MDVCMCVCIYICMCVCVHMYIYNIYVQILVICIHCQVWAWLALCFPVTLADFAQLNACWVLVMLMARFLLTNDIFG